MQFASQQLVAAAAHDLSPRVAQQIYNQIAAVKPGDKTSIKGLRDIIVNQIVPTLARRRAVRPTPTPPCQGAETDVVLRPG